MHLFRRFAIITLLALGTVEGFTLFENEGQYETTSYEKVTNSINFGKIAE